MRNANRRPAMLRSSLFCLALGLALPAAASELREGQVLGGAAPQEALTAAIATGDPLGPDRPRAAELAISVDAVGDYAFERVRIAFEGLLFPAEEDRLRGEIGRLLAERGVVADEAAPIRLIVGRGGVGYAPEQRYVYIRGGSDQVYEDSAGAIISTEVPFGERSSVATPYIVSAMAVAADGEVLWQGAAEAPFAGVDREVAAMGMLVPLIDALGRTVRDSAVTVPVVQPALTVAPADVAVSEDTPPAE